MNYFFVLLVFLFGFLTSQAQESRGDLALGQWKSHLPYSKGVAVTQSKEKVFFATNKSIFSVDKEEHSIELYNKVNGLSDIGIRTINYYTDEANPENQFLFVAYENSNIDLVTKDGLINLNDIKRKSIAGDKRINHIFFEGDYAWLSCGFGIVKLDLKELEILFTTFTNLVVNTVSLYQGDLYASTEEGIFVAPNDASTNLLDFGNWELLATDVGFPSAYYSNASAVLEDKLYADVNDTLFVFDGSTWASFFNKPNDEIHSIYAGNGQLLLNHTSPFPDRISKVNPDGTSGTIWNDDLTGSVPQSLIDEAGNIWVADFFRGYGMLTPDFELKKFELEGPITIDVGDITIVNNEVWMAAANMEPKWNYRSNNFGFASFIDGEWETYRRIITPPLDSVRDINAIVVHPSNQHIFASSYGGGLIEFDRENFTIHKQNSSLQAPTSDPLNYRVAGLVFDTDNNLWICNYEAPQPISVYTAEGDWMAFGPNNAVNQLTNVIIDQNGYKWFTSRNSGLLVYDSGDELLSNADDRYKVLNTTSSALETNDIRSITMDLDGYIWVGTVEGVYLFDCTGQVFDNECPGRRPIAQEGGINDLLLGNEVINAITVDGANRKWFGTSNGIFVLNTDADEAVYSFNTENSPLFDNNIVDIAINGETGEVFIGTQQGIMSYRANATDGTDFFIKDNVYAFPNPVRPDFEGEIAIKGLVTDANVKITDVSGTLIYETTALGGQAIWNGMDYNGNRASSGVYLVFMTNKNGLEKMVTKVLVMN